MAVQAGKLRHRITFEEIVETADGLGGVTTSVGTTTSLWASLMPKVKAEVFENEQIRGVVIHPVRIRFTTLVSDLLKTEFTFRGRRFKVLGIADNDEKQEFIDLLTTELPASG